MRWLPTVKWERIKAGDCRDLGLDSMWPWEGLYVGWFGLGVLLCARVVKTRS